MKPLEEASDSVGNTEYREVKSLKQNVSLGSRGGGGNRLKSDSGVDLDVISGAN